MSDRLPVPQEGASSSMIVERASATPSRVTPRHEHWRADPAGPGPIEVPRTLRDVQAWMVRAISGTEEEASAADGVVTGGHSLSGRERFEIYRYGYRARLVDCLLDDYPVIAQTLGEEAFESLCHAYVERHPSSSPSLNAFGRHLAAFLAEATLDATLPVPRRLLSDLAALEWALVEVIHAETPPPLDLSALQALPPDAWAPARFEPSAAVRLLRFEYPVNPYFQACRRGAALPPTPGPKVSATVVYRQGLTVWRMDLTPAMTRVLGALLASAPIGEALARLGLDESDPEAIAEAERSVMVWFREWVSSGLFARLRAG